MATQIKTHTDEFNDRDEHKEGKLNSSAYLSQTL
jgi:hypothetical protein